MTMSAAAAKDTMEMNQPTSEKSAEGTTKDDKGNVAMGSVNEIVEEIGLKAEDVAMGDIEESVNATATTMMIPVSPVVAENKTITADTTKPKEDHKDEQGEAEAIATTTTTTEPETMKTTTTEVESIATTTEAEPMATTTEAEPMATTTTLPEPMATTTEAETTATLPATTTSLPEPEVETEAHPSPAKVLEFDGGVGVLSEEQTNAALAALQEASTIVIEAKEAEEAKATASDKKRKATDPPEKMPAKKRGPPVRVAWNDRIAMLSKYKEDFGNLLIPIRYKLNPSLGKFVHNTREQYKLFHKKTPLSYKKKCSLTAERIQQLEDLGFVWSTERTKRQNEDWEARLIQLKQYKEKNGDCLVPHGYDADASFAEWIHRQRTAYASMEKEAKPNPLVKERMDKLEELGFNFTVHSDKWMDHWKMLKEYRDKHGHVQVPTHYADNPKLGRWVHTQRHQRRLHQKFKKSCMTEERVALLDQLQFSWEVRPSLERPRATWQQRLDELKDFFAAEQHFRVPPGSHPQLHSWCQEQKHRLKNVEKNSGKDVSRRMGPDRVVELHDMGFTKDVELALPKTAEDAAAAANQDTEAAPEPEDTVAAASKGGAEVAETSKDGIEAAETSKVGAEAAGAVVTDANKDGAEAAETMKNGTEAAKNNEQTTETVTTEEEVLLAVEEAADTMDVVDTMEV